MSRQLIKSLKECSEGAPTSSVSDGGSIGSGMYNTVYNTPGIGNADIGGADRWDNISLGASSKKYKKAYFKVRRKKSRRKKL